jgi:hypothetical protein
MVRHDVAIIRELSFADATFTALGHDLSIEQLAHFSIGAEFPKPSRMEWIFNSADAELSYCLDFRSYFPSAAETRTMNRADLVATNSHDYSPGIEAFAQVYHWWMAATVFFQNLFRDQPTNPSIHSFTHGVAYLSGTQWNYTGIDTALASTWPVPITPQDFPALKTWIYGIFGDAAPEESDYKPGTAYKRISRRVLASGNLQQAIDQKALTQSFVALKLLLAKMQDVFETVEPSPSNLQTYGHKIRELLLLAAMEVEASWAAVLKANGYAEDRFTTRDYVKLLEPMRLDSFVLALRSYPGFPSFNPFKSWDAVAPTMSLGWYDAYNRTKHNREECLGVATLERAVHAVGAAVAMLYAQFGIGIAIGEERSNLLRNVFTLKVDPAKYPTACYIPAPLNGARTWEWELIDYPFPPA